MCQTILEQNRLGQKRRLRLSGGSHLTEVLPRDTAFLAQAATTLGLRGEGKVGAEWGGGAAELALQVVQTGKREAPAEAALPHPCPQTVNAPKVAPRGLGAQVCPAEPLLELKHLLPAPVPPPQTQTIEPQGWKAL